MKTMRDRLTSTLNPPQIAAAKPYSHPGLPQPGQTITFQGLRGPATVNDYQVLSIEEGDSA